MYFSPILVIPSAFAACLLFSKMILFLLKKRLPLGSFAFILKGRLPFLLLTLASFSSVYLTFFQGQKGYFLLMTQGFFLFLFSESLVAFFSLFTKKKSYHLFFRLLFWPAIFAYMRGYLDPFLQALGSIKWQIGSNQLSLLSLSKAILATAFFIWLALIFSRYLEKKIENHKYLQPSMRLIFAKLTKIFSLSFSLYLGFSVLGVDLSAFSFFAGALGVGVAFGLQNILANFFCGLILLLDRSIKPGDVISLGDSVYGVVHKLNARYVSVKTRQGKEHLIPNQQIVTNKLENWSYSDSLIRLEVPFKVHLNTDLEELETLLIEIARNCPRVIKTPSPSVRFTDLASNGIELKLHVWIRDPQNGLSGLRSEILLKAWKRFCEKGIKLPPQFPFVC